MNGERIQSGGGQGLVHWTKWKLLDAQAANTDGVWVDTDGFYPFSLQISGITSASVILCGSNAEVRPANTDHGTPLHSTLTGDLFLGINMPVSWIKCRVTGYSAGTITAILKGTGVN